MLDTKNFLAAQARLAPPVRPEPVALRPRPDVQERTPGDSREDLSPAEATEEGEARAAGHVGG